MFDVTVEIPKTEILLTAMSNDSNKLCIFGKFAVCRVCISQPYFHFFVF